MEEKQEKSLCEKLNEKVEEIIQKIVDEDTVIENIEALYQLEDIHKDLANENYWKIKEEDIMYRGYGDSSYGDSYGRRGVPGTGRGRYRDSGSYGRRGVPGSGRGRYRGEEMIDEMAEHFGNYSESRDAYHAGNYGAKEDNMKSLKYMLKALEDFTMYLVEDADSEEEVEMIKQTLRKSAEM